MAEPIHAPKTITVGVDGTSGSRAALRWAIALAEQTGASIQAVMAWRYPYLSTMPGLIGAVPPITEMERASVEALGELIGNEAAGVPIEPVVAMGSGSQVLIDASRGQDLLVVGRRGNPRLGGLGSTSRHCAIHAATSVAVIPADSEPLPPQPTVAVAVDGSLRSINALVWAIETFPAESKLSAVHSHDEQMLDYHDLPDSVRDGLSARAERRLADSVDRALVRVERAADIEQHIYEGDPRTTVLDGTWGVDVLVVGDRGHSGVPGLLLGSFSTHAVGHADLPVIVARL